MKDPTTSEGIRSDTVVTRSEMLFPSFANPPERPAVRFQDRALSYSELAGACVRFAADIRGFERIAIVADPAAETCVAVVGALMAGIPAVPINPQLGSKELAHVLDDSRPSAVVATRSHDLPPALQGLPRVDIEFGSLNDALPPEADPDAPALIFYTSGTTGLPKGVVLPRRAISSNLDDLAVAWNWTSDDVLAHGLPLFHVHGLVLGVLGPLRVGASLHHVGRFSVSAINDSLRRGATMFFGVPTMYHALADAASTDRTTAALLAKARLLVSGSAPLPVSVFKRFEQATGRQIVERYGLTETLMNCAVREQGERRPGYVGPPLRQVEVMLVDDAGDALDVDDDETIGEVAVRGPNLFLEYLNRPDATAAALRDGWFYTGDLATRSADGYLRILGRRATDLIKTGGFKVGAGEVEAALMEHPLVKEAAVTGVPDERLGEQIVAWVVARGGEVPPADELIDHVAQLLAPHKRPRAIRFVPELPRNAMGKIVKSALRSG